MRIGLSYSIILHIILLIVLMVGVDYSRKLEIEQDTVLLELVPLSTLTNVKTSTNDVKQFDKNKELISNGETKQDKKTVLKDSKFDNENVSHKRIELQEKQALPQPKPQQKLEEKKIEKNVRTIEDREKVPSKDIKKEPEVKKEEKKDKARTPSKETAPKKKANEKTEKTDKTDKKPKEAEEQLANTALKSLQEGGKKSSKHTKDKSLNDIMENAIRGDTSTDFDAESNLSMSEISAIRSQISQAWRVTAFSGGKDNKSMKVIIAVKVDSSGEVTDMKVKTRQVPAGVDSAVYNAFVDSVIRAIKTASPLQNLPEDKHETWREMELTFDSSGMIY